ncbi:hypothetical protein HPB49_013189 [Dermacentor silvarum]|uniref:Uncharacterized protein n=1 Tax=Dermacentor silvarum TaxID=543639 RepID=A0ACB8DCP1_DERSI|nr:hypothetical protein HPB49_013189 [Dermacentor silvarum]
MKRKQNNVSDKFHVHSGVRDAQSYTTVRCVKSTVAEASRGRGGTVAAAGTVAGTRLRYRVRGLAMMRPPLRCPAATHEDRDPGSTHSDRNSLGFDQERPLATAPWQEPLSRPRPWSRNRPPHQARVGTPWSLGRSRNNGPSSSSRASHPICCHRGFAARARPHVLHVALLFFSLCSFFLPAPVPPALSSPSSLRWTSVEGSVVEEAIIHGLRRNCPGAPAKFARGLMRHLFTAEELRGKSLFGRRSYAQPSAPQRKALDPAKVNAIIGFTVTEYQADPMRLKTSLSSLLSMALK